MSAVVHGVRALTRIDAGWIATKFATGILLPVTLFTWQPLSVKAGIISAPVLAAVLILMMSGAVIAIAGILARVAFRQPSIIGYALEVGGTVGLVIGPAILAVIFGSYSYSTGSNPTGAVLSVTLSVPFIARIMDILTYHLVPKGAATEVMGDDGSGRPSGREAD